MVIHFLLSFKLHHIDFVVATQHLNKAIKNIIILKCLKILLKTIVHFITFVS